MLQKHRVLQVKQEPIPKPDWYIKSLKERKQFWYDNVQYPQIFRDRINAPLPRRLPDGITVATGGASIFKLDENQRRIVADLNKVAAAYFAKVKESQKQHKKETTKNQLVLPL